MSEFDERVKLAILTLTEAVADVATHAGYSRCKKLADEIEKILDGATPLPASTPAGQNEDASHGEDEEA